MAKDQSTTQGLITDPTPDRLGDGAMDLANMVPASQTTVAPRLGVSLVAHYVPSTTGRFVFADALPGAEGNGVLIVCEQQQDGEDLPHTDGVFDFYPRAVAPSYAMVTGYPPATPSDGILNYFVIDVENEVA